MSLINDALLDLQARGASSFTEELSEHIVAAPEKGNSQNRRLWPLLLAGVLGSFFLLFNFFHVGPNDQQKVVSLVVAPNVDAVEEPSNKMLKSQTDVAPGLIEGSDATWLVVHGQEKEKIDDLLIMAKNAFDKHQLTLPFGRNAFAYYSEVVELDPDNPLAQQGLLQLEERYTQILLANLRKNNIDKSKSMLSRADELGVNIDGREFILDFISRSELMAATTKEKLQHKEESMLTEAADLPMENHSDTIQMNLSENGKEAAIESEDTNQKSSITIEESSEYRIGQQLLAVDNLLVNRQFAMAEVQLKFVLDSSPGNAQALIRLFDLFLTQSHIGGARDLSLESLKSPTLEIYMKARLAQLDVGDLAALAILDEHNPDVNLSEKYYSYYAALLQKNKRWNEAEGVYQRLVRINMNVANYWLGLAVSLDELEDDLGALQAYQQVRKIGSHNRSIADFCQTRITELSDKLTSERKGLNKDSGLANVSEW